MGLERAVVIGQYAVQLSRRLSHSHCIATLVLLVFLVSLVIPGSRLRAVGLTHARYFSQRGFVTLMRFHVGGGCVLWCYAEEGADELPRIVRAMLCFSWVSRPRTARSAVLGGGGAESHDFPPSVMCFSVSRDTT